jgi:hypothetical protein
VTSAVTTPPKVSEVTSILDAMNPARNRGSLAHPNEDLLGEHEAILFINAARTILQYLDAKLARDVEPLSAHR